MRKLRLELEELAVKSFWTAEGTATVGTVRGHDGVIISDDNVIRPGTTDLTVCTCPTSCTGVSCCDSCGTTWSETVHAPATDAAHV